MLIPFSFKGPNSHDRPRLEKAAWQQISLKYTHTPLPKTFKI